MKIQKRANQRVVLSVLALAALTSCGGSYGGGGGGGGSDGNSYTIGGDVTGLTSSGLVLQVNGDQDLAISADGAFTFADPIKSGAIFRVTVLTQPSAPSQTCTPHNAVGTVPKSNVTDVEINCAAVAGFTVGGIVSELEGSGLVLQNNAGDNLRVTANGEFVFETKVPDGTGYAVTVRKQPSDPAQTCVVGSLSGGDGTGTIDAAKVSNIWIVCGAHFAYATNAGDNSVSSYSLNPVTGTLTEIGTPIATGTSPFAIAASPDKKHVYVVNRGSDDISAYAVNATSGTLTEIAGSPFSAGDDPQSLVFNATGSYLYVANHGSGELSAYSVDAGTGALTPLSPATYATGAGPSSVVVDPAGKFVYVANDGGTNDISAFAITSATGALSPVAGSPFAAGNSPHALAVTHTRTLTFIYAAGTDGAASTIVGFSANTSNGRLTAVSGSPFDISVSHYMGVFHGTGDILYVTTGDGVASYFSDASTGELFANSAAPTATGVNAFSVAAQQLAGVHLPYLYVANDGAANISAFRVDDLEGSLVEAPGSPFAAGNNPNFIVIL